MKKHFAAAAMAVSTIAFGLPAAADVYIGLQNGGPGITTVASGPTAAVFGALGSFLPFGNYEANALTAVDPFDPGVLTTTLNVHNAAGTSAGVFDLYFTTTDISGPVPTTFDNAFTLNAPFPAGWQLAVETLVDAANGIYTGTQIFSHNFTATGVTGLVTTGFGGPFTGPYSVTQHYRITPSDNALLNMGATGATIAGVIPEPATWAMMIIGFAGMGVALRSRRAMVLAA